MKSITKKIKKNRNIKEIKLGNILIIFEIILILLAFNSIIGRSEFDKQIGWHSLANIVTKESGGKSLDENGNGIVDSVDNCNSNDVCEAKKFKITGGSPLDGKMLVSDNNGLASWQSSTLYTSGMIAFFNNTVCPTGWSEYVAARGRSLVGLNTGGTLGQTIGTALSNLENRDVSYHYHSFNNVLHPHNNADASGNDWTFIHWWPNSVNTGYYNTNQRSGSIYGYYILSAAYAGAISLLPAGTTSGTNAPYIQYLACVKD